MTGFPGAIGIIDGTHVGILKPLATEILPERFYNRKHYHSVNCIVVCDHLCRVRYFTIRHAGSAHDSGGEFTKYRST
jgi:hypothetical protein